MPGRLGPRFAIEAGFLILLAVAAGLADLSWQAIVLVMGVAWLLVAILEWAMWREGPRLPPPVPPSYAVWQAEAPAPPPSEPLPPPPEAATRVIPAPQQPVGGAEESVAEEKPKRRRWRRRPQEQSAPVAEASPPPKHVRLLPRDGGESKGEG